MRSFSLFWICILLSPTLFGQISIDSSNLVHVGQNITLTDGLHSSVNLTAAAVSGANQLWDFSTLDSIDSFSTTFENAATGINASKFPNASFAVNEIDVSDTVSDYYLKSASEFSFLGESGLVSGDTLTLHLKFEMLSLPSSFDSSFSTENRDTNLMSDSRLVYATSVVSNIDGWGKVTMPKGTFPAIRQKVKKSLLQIFQTQDMGGNWITVDSELSVSNAYVWWTNDAQVKWPLLEIDYDSLNMQVNYITYVNIKPQTTGIQEQNIASSLSVVPNPASDYIDFSVKKQGNYELSVFNMLGRRCIQQQFKGEHCRLHLSRLADGIYQYRLTNKSTDRVLTGKFVKE